MNVLGTQEFVLLIKISVLNLHVKSHTLLKVILCEKSYFVNSVLIQIYGLSALLRLAGIECQTHLFDPYLAFWNHNLKV